MSDKEIISAVKYVSRMKPEFMLSEIRDYIKEDMTTGHIHDIIGHLAFDLDLKITPTDGDYRVTRVSPAKLLVLDEEERRLQEEFLASARVPGKLEDIIEKYIVKKTTRQWDDPVVLEKIRKAIVAQKAEYWKEGENRKISYDKGYSILGYMAYQFPVYFAQFEHILYGLARDGLLKDRMRVLDVGTGPGTASLAIIDFYQRLGRGEADIYSLEKYDENIEAFTYLAMAYAESGGASIQKPIKADLAHIVSDNVPENFDLMVFSNVLNELETGTERKAEIVMALAKKLAPDGNILIIEPADKVNSMEMRKLTVALMKKGLGVYSPCSFIWCSSCNPVSCWTFEEKEDIKPTGLMKKIAEEEPYRFMNTDIKYSYAVLRKDTLSREKYRVPTKARFARLSKLKIHQDKRINVVASVMSGDLGDPKNHVFKICDGTSVKPVYAVIPFYHQEPNNEALKKAKYGDVIEIYNVLVRYNKEYDSYNLLVTRNTKINPVA